LSQMIMVILPGILTVFVSDSDLFTRAQHILIVTGTSIGSEVATAAHGLAEPGRDHRLTTGMDQTRMSAHGSPNVKQIVSYCRQVRPRRAVERGR
jgi:hypothetical protein